MKKYLFLASAVVISTQAQAAPEFNLTEECKSSLKAKILNVELARMAAEGDELASEFKVDVSLWHTPSRPDVSVSVSLEDPADGRRVRYSAKVTKADALECRVWLERKDSSVCRYSTDAGPNGLNDLKLKGLKFRSGRDIKPESRLTTLEVGQIELFLGENMSNVDTHTIADLIRQTDDQELSTGTVMLPGGRRLTYYGAYGGDNPFGMFFEEGSTDIVGENSDGSVCIR